MIIWLLCQTPLQKETLADGSVCSYACLCESGGNERFSEAARQLQMAVSSITRQVNALEDMLNTQLLNRSTRSISLTGHANTEQAVRILQEVESANQCVAEQEEVRGLLKVSMPVAFGRIHIAPIVNDFLSIPEVRLDLRLSDGLSNLVEEELDVVIRIGNLDRSGVISSSVRLTYTSCLRQFDVFHSMVT